MISYSISYMNSYMISYMVSYMTAIRSLYDCAGHKNPCSCLFNTHCNQPAFNSNAIESVNEPLNSNICNIIQN